MEITIDRTEALAGLALAKGVTPRRSTIPILANVLIRADVDGVTFAATDLEVSTRRACAADVAAAGAVTVGAHQLAAMLKDMPAGPVRLSGTGDGAATCLEVSGGVTALRLYGLPAADYPALPAVGDEAGPVAVVADAATFAAMLARVLFAVSTDETRPNLNGVHLEASADGRLTMTGTDGHRLSTVTRAAEVLELPRGFTLPRKACAELAKILKKRTGPVTIRLRCEAPRPAAEASPPVLSADVFGPDAAAAADAVPAESPRPIVATINHGAVTLTARLADGEFPDYRQVIPGAPASVVRIDGAGMLAALRRLSTVSSERTRGVRLDLGELGAVFTVSNPDVGDASERMPAAVDGPAVSVGFNGRYLTDFLSVLAPAELAALELATTNTDGTAPGVLRTATDPDFSHVVMPMRL